MGGRVLAAEKADAASCDVVIGGDLGRIADFQEAGVTWIRHGWFRNREIDHDEWVANVLTGRTD